MRADPWLALLAVKWPHLTDSVLSSAPGSVLVGRKEAEKQTGQGLVKEWEKTQA